MHGPLLNQVHRSLFCNSLLDGVPEYRIFAEKYECGLITKIISAMLPLVAGTIAFQNIWLFLVTNNEKKNKHQSKKGNDMNL